jgi:L-rhamnose-H+ transport protein
MNMQPGFALGIFLVFLGAFANGSFGLMLKYAKTWKWEHLWLIYSGLAFLVIPWALGFATVSDLPTVLTLANRDDLVKVFLFGLGWGIGSVLYGLALKLVGMALSYAIVVGLTAAIGSIAPLVFLHRSEVFTLRGKVIILGVVLIVAGVVLSSWAGQIKERVRAASPGPAVRGEGFKLGLVVAILSGILSPMLNLSFAYGTPLTDLAVSRGTHPLLAPNIIWAIALSAGFLVNAGYCVYLISGGGSWRVMKRERFHYGLGLSMALLWLSGIICYGSGGSKLGNLGAVVGWPLMSSMAIISASFWGALAGEWTGSSRQAVAVMWISVAVLTVAMFVVAWGDRLG